MIKQYASKHHRNFLTDSKKASILSKKFFSFFCQTKQDVSVRSKTVLSFNFAKLSFFEKKNSDISTESMWIMLFAF